MKFNNEKRYGYYQKYSPQIGYALLRPGELSIYISPEAAGLPLGGRDDEAGGTVLQTSCQNDR